MLSSLVFAAALSASDAPLDAVTLKAAIQEAKQAPAAAPVGRAFKIAIPFVDGRKRDVPTFQSPARWVYDYKRNQLDLIIGPGEITPANYDQFSPQGLDKLPPLQSFVFDSRQVTDMTGFNIDNRTKAHARANDGLGDGRGDTYELGTRSWLTSFAIAVPYDAHGVSGLPGGMRPLAIHRVESLPQRDLRRFVGHMTLVLEGETTDLGQKPPAFCGGFVGAVTSRGLTDQESFAIRAKQCFVTARIDKVTVLRGNEVLASWPRAPATAD
jgi:hypothetical protein